MPSLTPNDILADLHTHTIASAHAYSTVYENIQCARAAGMRFLAVTDHYYQHGDYIDRKNEIVLMSNVSKDVRPEGLTMINGMELNVGQSIDRATNLEKIYRDIRWRPVGMHSMFIRCADYRIEDVPSLFEMTVTDSKYITPTAFAHIERKLGEFRGGDDDRRVKNALAEIIEVAEKYHIILELNEGSLARSRSVYMERMRYWLTLASKRDVLLSMGTDAHYCEWVGRFDKLIALMNETGVDGDKVLNVNTSLLEPYI